jgi:O-antigen/teichoic acid export membrane protein
MRLYVSPRVVRDGFHELPGMLGFGVRLVPAKFATGFMSQADVWLLGLTSSVSQVGAYARASGLATRMNDAGYRVSEILYPSLCERFERDGAASCRPLVERVARMTALPMFAAAAFGAATAPGLLQVFGHGFSRASSALALLLVAYSLSVLVLVEGQILLAVGKPGTTSIISVTRAILAVGFMVPLGAEFGSAGVASAIVLAQLSAWILQTERIGPVLGWPVARRVLTFGATIAVTTAAGFAAGRLAYDAAERAGGVVFGVAAGGALSAIVFIAVALLTGWLRADVVREAQRVVRRRRKR